MVGLFLKMSGILTTKAPGWARARNPIGFEQEATERTEGCLARFSLRPPVQEDLATAQQVQVGGRLRGTNSEFPSLSVVVAVVVRRGICRFGTQPTARLRREQTQG